jgi:hypothetical protein
MKTSDRELMDMLFGKEAMINLNTCAKVMLKPGRVDDDFPVAWMPVGWDHHQPMLFVAAQDPPSPIIKPGVPEDEMMVYSYACMNFLSNDLKTKIREELGLAEKKPPEDKDAN